MDKVALRKKMLEIRHNIDNRSCKDAVIFEKAVRFIEKINAEIIFSYVSMGSEVDTKALLSYYIGKKKLLVPKTDKVMCPVILDSAVKLTADKLGNIENVGLKSAYEGKIDLCIVPLLAFNKSLFRLGYGGGYYDKYLSKNNVFSLGLAYDEQETSLLETENFDKKLDCIITPEKIILEEKN